MIEITTSDQLAAVRGKLAKLPVVAQRVAARGAERFSELARETFDARENVAGEPWADGVDGKPVTLQKTGRTRSEATRFRAVGTRIMASVGSVPYARFQLKRGFLPRKLPRKWADELTAIANDELTKHLTGRA